VLTAPESGYRFHTLDFPPPPMAGRRFACMPAFPKPRRQLPAFPALFALDGKRLARAF
jgi:hypothetical protein